MTGFSIGSLLAGFIGGIVTGVASWFLQYHLRRARLREGMLVRISSALSSLHQLARSAREQEQIAAQLVDIVDRPDYDDEAVEKTLARLCSRLTITRHALSVDMYLEYLESGDASLILEWSSLCDRAKLLDDHLAATYLRLLDSLGSRAARSAEAPDERPMFLSRRHAREHSETLNVALDLVVDAANHAAAFLFLVLQRAPLIREELSNRLRLIANEQHGQLLRDLLKSYTAGSKIPTSIESPLAGIRVLEEPQRDALSRWSAAQPSVAAAGSLELRSSGPQLNA